MRPGKFRAVDLGLASLLNFAITHFLDIVVIVSKCVSEPHQPSSSLVRIGDYLIKRQFPDNTPRQPIEFRSEPFGLTGYAPTSLSTCLLSFWVGLIQTVHLH